MPEVPANLNDYSFKKGDERTRELGRKGGKKSGESRRKKKNRAQVVADILDHGISDRQRKQIESMIGELDEDDYSVFTLMAIGMVKAAMKGNVTAFESLVELADTGKIVDGEQEDELSKSLRELGESL